MQQNDVKEMRIYQLESILFGSQDKSSISAESPAPPQVQPQSLVNPSDYIQHLDGLLENDNLQPEDFLQKEEDEVEIALHGDLDRQEREATVISDRMSVKSGKSGRSSISSGRSQIRAPPSHSSSSASSQKSVHSNP